MAIQWLSISKRVSAGSLSSPTCPLGRARRAAARLPRLLDRRAPLSRLSGLHARPDHRNPARDRFRLLPALPHQLDRLDRIEISIKHPMVSPAKVSDVVGIVVPGIVVEVSDR